MRRASGSSRVQTDLSEGPSEPTPRKVSDTLNATTVPGRVPGFVFVGIRTAGTAASSRHGNDADYSDPERNAENKRQHDAASTVQLVKVRLCVHGAIVATSG